MGKDRGRRGLTESGLDLAIIYPLQTYYIADHLFEFFKNRDIKIYRLFGIVIEPQEWGDFLHVVFLVLIKLLSKPLALLGQ